MAQAVEVPCGAALFGSPTRVREGEEFCAPSQKGITASRWLRRDVGSRLRFAPGVGCPGRRYLANRSAEHVAAGIGCDCCANGRSSRRPNRAPNGTETAASDGTAAEPLRRTAEPLELQLLRWRDDQLAAEQFLQLLRVHPVVLAVHERVCRTVRGSRLFALGRPQWFMLIARRKLTPAVSMTRAWRRGLIRPVLAGATLTALVVMVGCGAAAGTASAPTPSIAPTVEPTAVPTAAPTPTALPASFGYLGATVAQFKAAHGADSGPGAICTAVNACFGPSLVNDESGPAPTYEFGNVSVDGGIVSGYSMNFATGTTIADAKAAVLAWLPRDTVTTLYKVDHNNGSCVLWNLRSPTLARELGTPKIGDPQGELGVTLGYVTSDLTNLYDPNNVEHADISVLPNSPTDSC